MRQRFTLIIILLFSCEILFPQNDFYSIDSNKIVLYFAITDNITIDSKAYFYRELKFNHDQFNLDGIISDYTWEGTKLFSSNLKNGYLSGSAEYYYENGNLKIKGNYKKGKRDGIWKYFYTNGEIEKQIKFSNDSLYIINLFNKKGKQLVIDGNGKYKGIITLGLKHDLEYIIKGEVKNYQLHGSWYIGTEIEKYDNGTLVKGYGSIINGFFNPYQSEKFYSSISVVLKKFESIEEAVLYEPNEIENFISKLKNELPSINNYLKLVNYTVLLSFDLDENMKLVNNKIFSTKSEIDLIIEDIVYKNWSSKNKELSTNDISFSIFIPIISNNNKIFIPRILNSAL